MWREKLIVNLALPTDNTNVMDGQKNKQINRQIAIA